MSKRTKRAQAAVKRRRRKTASEIGTGWTKAARERGAESIAARTNARARTLAPTIKRARAAGATSLHAIARYLNEQGIPTTRGYEWSAVQVARVIRRLAQHAAALAPGRARISLAAACRPAMTLRDSPVRLYVVGPLSGRP